MTPTQREAALRLSSTTPIMRGGTWPEDVAALLRELAAEPTQEPVAWQERQARRIDKASGRITEWSGWYACRERKPDEPLSYTDPDEMIPREWRPLYTAPPPASRVPDQNRAKARVVHFGAEPQRQPLTDEQIGKLIRAEWDTPAVPSARAFARAIERAHGIGGKE